MQTARYSWHSCAICLCTVVVKRNCLVCRYAKNSIIFFDEHRIVCEPSKTIIDFKKSIINACQEVYSNCPFSCCFFHFGQSIYRKIQSIGLQAAYNDPDDRLLKMYSHMMLWHSYFWLKFLAYFCSWKMMHLKIYYQFSNILKKIYMFQE